ncbi:MAG: uracil-DNA glycosylase [Bacilli bacterium]|nr:uracil-DNA glycosylase [Bacilli bacterium]
MDFKTIIDEEKQKPYFKELAHFVNEQYRTKRCFPPYEQIFRCFKETPFDEVKVVILGQDPYYKQNQADGLAFSVLKENKVPKSLINIYKELNNDLGIVEPNVGDLTKWAKNGVLLMNTILTVEEGKPLSHQNKGWETFSINVIKKLSLDPKPKVFLLWGNNARSYHQYINDKIHLVIETSHPSPLGAYKSFFNSHQFSRCNQFLKENNRGEIDFQL